MEPNSSEYGARASARALFLCISLLLDLRDLRISEFCEFLLQEFELFVLHVLDINEHVARRVYRADELVELEVDGVRVAVLRVLDEEDHEEGEDRRPGIDDELPVLGEAEKRPGNRPSYDSNVGKSKSLRRADLF